MYNYQFFKKMAALIVLIFGCAFASTIANAQAVFVDEFDGGNASKASLALDSSNVYEITSSTVLFDDNTRLTRLVASSEGFLVYKTENFTYAIVDGVMNKEDNIHFKFFSSKDNQEWAEITTFSTAQLDGESWFGYRYTVPSFPLGTAYFKIIIPSVEGGEVFGKQLMRVTLGTGTIQADASSSVSLDEGVMTSPQFGEDIKLLYGMGILSNVSSDALDHSVSRREFAGIVAKMAAVENISLPLIFNPFSDVSEGSENSDAIKMLASMGYMKGVGDGLFMPDDGIKSQDALYAMLCLLGYNMDIYSNNVYEMAGNLGLIRNLPLDDSSALNMKMVAQLAYATLKSRIVGINANGSFSTSENNYLWDKFKITRESGQVTSTHYGRIAGKSFLNSDEICINMNLYKINDGEIDRLIGYSIDFYVEKSDYVPRIVSYEPSRNKNRVLRINADRMLPNSVNLQQNRLAYLDEKEYQRSVSIAISFFLENGMRKTAFDASDFIITSGFIQLIDADGDNVYETLIKEQYHHYLVDSVGTDRINGKYGGEFLSLDPNQYTNLVIIKEGRPIAQDQIKKNDVVSAAISQNNEFLLLIVTTQSITGSVLSIEEGRGNVQIGEETYGISSTYEDLLDKNTFGVAPIKVGMNGTFYLDCQGRIAGVLVSTSKDSYAFMIRPMLSQSVSKSLQIKLFTSDGQLEELYARDRIIIDDSVTSKRYTGEEAMSLLTLKNYSEGLIKYDLDSEGKINRLYLPAPSRRAAVFSMDYDVSNAFTNGSDIIDSLYCIGGATLFAIPHDRYDDAKYSNSFKFLSGTRTSAASYRYRVQLFDTDSTNRASAAVVYIADNDGSSQTVEYNSLATVSKITTSYDEDEGKEIENIYLFQGGKETKYCLAALASVSGMTAEGKLTPGDVIQFGVDYQGKIARIIIFYRADANAFNTGSGIVTGFGVNTAQAAEFMVVYGEVVSVSSPYVLIEAGVNSTMMKLDSTNIAVFHQDTGKIEPGKTSDISVGERVVARSNRSRASDVIIIR